MKRPPQWLLLPLLISVASCSAGQSNDYCLIAQPIRPSTADMGAMSDALVQQILTHDKTGQALCGWVP